MTSLNIVSSRLYSQHIAENAFSTPVDVVQWMGAVQAQDFAAAKWAVGLRMSNATDDDIERAFTDGSILRTHVMRPTWHFVSPSDIRWLLALTAPRVFAAMAHYNRQLELDAATFLRSNIALEKALQGGKQLTRAELVLPLQQAGIAADDGLRMTHLMMHAELDGIVCSGARRGKQFTYALLDERVPRAPVVHADEALAELVKRYFTSHGPATLQDFAWWSGLTGVEAKAGLEMNTASLLHENVNGQTYWFSGLTQHVQKLASPTAYLLPNYDEYTVSYKDRSDILDNSYTGKLLRNISPFNHVIILDGQIVGSWKRRLSKNIVFVDLNAFITMNETEMQAITVAAERYAAFLGLPVEISFQQI